MTTSTTTIPTDVALPASGDLLDWICTAAKEGIVIAPVRGVMVRSGDYEKAHHGAEGDFLAVEFMEFSATGAQKHVGMWAEDKGGLYALDDTARAFTTWPAPMDPMMSVGSQAAQQAKAGLRVLSPSSYVPRGVPRVFQGTWMQLDTNAWRQNPERWQDLGDAGDGLGVLELDSVNGLSMTMAPFEPWGASGGVVRVNYSLRIEPGVWPAGRPTPRGEYGRMVFDSDTGWRLREELGLWIDKEPYDPQNPEVWYYCMTPDRRRLMLYDASGKENRLYEKRTPRFGYWASASPTNGYPVDTSPPDPRAGAAMAYDSVTGTVVLYGGNGLDRYTWVYDPAVDTWTRLFPAVDWAPACWSPQMVCDPRTGKVILFSEWPGSYAFDPATGAWTKITTSGDVPDPHAYYSVVYDSDTSRIIRFGGSDAVGDAPLDGTWAYDPAAATWTELHPQGDVPPARIHHAMVYDSSSGKVILFGGIGLQTLQALDDTWAYDPAANKWTRLQPQGEQPPARAWHTMVYDPVGHKVILFGGSALGSNGPLDDTWAYDPAVNTWTRLHPSGGQPMARAWPAMVYDPVDRRMMLFGGVGLDGYLRDAWAYDPAANTWTKLAGNGSTPHGGAPITTTSTAFTTTVRQPGHLGWGESAGVMDDAAHAALDVTVYPPEVIPDGSRMKNKEADKLVAVLVEVGNSSPNGKTFDVLPTTWFFLKDADGVLYHCQLNLQEGKHEFPAGPVSRDHSTRGYVVFEMPEGAQPEAVLCAPLGSDPLLTWSD